MKAVLRQACEADVPILHQIRCSVRENRLSAASGVTEASYLPHVRSGGTWVAEADGRIVGFGTVDLSHRTVWALFVAPQAEGSGVGRALHDRMLAWARETGVSELSLSTSHGTRAERFYLAAGWRPCGSGPGEQVILSMRLNKESADA